MRRHRYSDDEKRKEIYLEYLDGKYLHVRGNRHYSGRGTYVLLFIGALFLSAYSGHKLLKIAKHYSDEINQFIHINTRDNIDKNKNILNLDDNCENWIHGF